MNTTMIESLSNLPCMILATTISLISFFFLYYYNYYTKQNGVLLNLPLVGLLPEVLFNFHGLQTKVTKLLEEKKGTFILKGAWLAQSDILITSDPANVQHIMSSSFSNYAKGSDWRKRFDIFGDHSIFNADFEVWQHNRKIARGFLSHHQFHQLLNKIVPDTIEKGLMPVLDHVNRQNIVVDLQDLFKRLTFDFASLIVIGSNPKSLSVGFPENVFPKALDDACVATCARHFVPESFWRLQRWLVVGKERKLSESWKTIDQFCAEHMSIKRKKLSKSAMATNEDDDMEEEGFDLLNCYLTGHEITGPTVPTDKIMRDNITSAYLAIGSTTTSTLSWFFWLLSKNPLVEIKIRRELDKNFHGLDDSSKLVYLHAALCETLRLFPPVPSQLRVPIRPDTLPSGHHVDDKTNIMISLYAMARMVSVWGEDCCEFKPERWITEDDRIKHEPAHKFFSFNAGPRICIGKDIAFTLMKSVAATIMNSYDVKVVESHPVVPNLSTVFGMKHGLMARVNNRYA
ncbi:hypothetical protein ACOSQ2_022379 [Xanthoceras sorbifolium]